MSDTSRADRPVTRKDVEKARAALLSGEDAMVEYLTGGDRLATHIGRLRDWVERDGPRVAGHDKAIVDAPALLAEIDAINQKWARMVRVALGSGAMCPSCGHDTLGDDDVCTRPQCRCNHSGDSQ